MNRSIDLQDWQAKAIIREAVRRRLAPFHGQDFWKTSFFVDRLDLTVTIYDYQVTNGNDDKSQIPSLLRTVKEEFIDFLYIEASSSIADLVDENVYMQCSLCNTSYDPKIGSSCPSCGYITFFIVAENGLSRLLSNLSVSNGESDLFVDKVLSSLKDWQLTSGYEKVVTILEHFLKELNRFLFFVSEQEPINPKRANLFQNIDEARDWYLNHHRCAIFGCLVASETEQLRLVLNKRHVLAHNMGIVDEVYLRRTNDQKAKAGSQVPLAFSELQAALEIVAKIIQYAREFVQANTQREEYVPQKTN